MTSLLEIARRHAEEAARMVMSAYGATAFTVKDDQSPVTETDHRVHDYLTKELGSTGIPVLSEEGEQIGSPYGKQTWIIDPIDGTRGFINGTGDFAVMIGLLEGERPILGVVHIPATNTQYYAERGQGAFMVKDCITTPLRVSDRRVPNLIGVQSLNHPASYMEHVNHALEAADILRVGSIGVKASVVTEGRADYFLTMGRLGEWDVCAPEIITCEAGGQVTDKTGDPLRYGNPEHRLMNGVVFSNGVCHREVLTALSLALRPLV